MALQSDNPELAFQLRYLAPKFWGMWSLLLLLRLSLLLPRMWVLRLGACIGDQFRRRNRKRRRIVEVNLALCFPDYTPEQRAQLAIEHFRAYGRSLADMGLTLWGSSEKIRSLVKTAGLEQHIQLCKRTNVIVVTWHLTTLELSGNVLSTAGPVVTMMNRMHNPVLTWVFARARCRFTEVKLLMRDEGLRPYIACLRAGRQGVIVADEDLGAKDSGLVFVPFFGAQRAILSTPARLAKSASARVATCASRLDPTTGNYLFTITPALEGVDGTDLVADTKAIAASMEQLISLAPEQYMWTFRWFKTRADDAPSPYDPMPAK